MRFFKKKKIIVTHNGSFHADDIFACATLSLYFERENAPYTIVRTRDEQKIKNADIVVDVGGIHDESQECYDHHQSGGAGSRDNGIPYASFGLVWKKYGPLLSANSEIMNDIDRRIVQAIDAIDNGMSITEPVECGLYDYGIHGIVTAYQNTWKEAGQMEKQYTSFIFLVNFFKKILVRELERCQHRLDMMKLIEEIYQETQDKTVLEIPYHVGVGSLIQVLDKHKEVLFIVCRSNTNWKVLAMRKEACSFENRKALPKDWAGKRGEALQKITGVSDAVFCHNALFMAVSESKEGAHQLARLALRD